MNGDIFFVGSNCQKRIINMRKGSRLSQLPGRSFVHSGAVSAADERKADVPVQGH